MERRENGKKGKGKEKQRIQGVIMRGRGRYRGGGGARRGHSDIEGDWEMGGEETRTSPTKKKTIKVRRI